MLHLFFQITHRGKKNASSQKYCEPIGTLDIRLRKIVLAYYHRKPYIEFAKFFVMNASLLELMTVQAAPGQKEGFEACTI
jgi:hypothetical protein